MSAATLQTLTVNATEVFWAVLDLRETPIRGRLTVGAPVYRRTAGLDEVFAQHLPIPLEEVKCAYAVIGQPGSERILAAAVRRETLSKLVLPDVQAVVPSHVPASLGLTAADGARTTGLNFLWGDLEAVPVRRATRTGTLWVLAAVIALSTVTALGLARRAGNNTARAKELFAEALELQRSAGVPMASAAELNEPVLDLELSRLRRTREVNGVAGAQIDAADALATLLGGWPRNEASASSGKLRVDQLTATTQSLTLSVWVQRQAEVEALGSSLRSIRGWTLLQPQFGLRGGGGGKGEEGGILSLRLVPASGPSVPGQEAGR